MLKIAIAADHERQRARSAARAQPLLEPGRKPAAQPREHQKSGEHDGDRVQGMAEEQGEALDRCDLDEQEGKADAVK